MNTLALQGGGCLGYGQVIILSALEKQAGKTLNNVFDLIGGTSVGCIISAPISIGLSVNKIKSFFTDSAPKIFHSSCLNNIIISRPKYNASELEISLQSMLGNLTLKDCKTKFIGTGYDCASDRPVYFKSYETSSFTKDEITIGYDSPIKLWQVCRASSAAQTYFPAFEYHDEFLNLDMILMDGGNIGDNAPDVLVITEASEFESLNNIKMLSIGAGDTKWNFNYKAMVSPSKIRAGLATIKIVFSAGESSEVYKAGKLIKGNYYRLVSDLGDGYDIDDASPETLGKLEDAANIVVKNSQSVYNTILGIKNFAKKRKK